jgi:hypothetical protein
MIVIFFDKNHVKKKANNADNPNNCLLKLLNTAC